MVWGAKKETVFLVHSSKGHFLHVTEPDKVVSPGVKYLNEGKISRVWFNFDKGLFQFLKKQKNSKRLCPLCTPDYDHWESKWEKEKRPHIRKGNFEL